GLHDEQAPWAWTYAELLDQAGRAAEYFAASGLASGDRVVFWGGNRPEWVAAFFGAQMLGAVVIPLDVRSQEELLVRIEQQTQPKHLLLGKEQAASLKGGSHPPHTLFEELGAKLSALAPASFPQPAADDIAQLV